MQRSPLVGYACVPSQGTSLPIGSMCTIIGWGKERNTHIFGTDVLHEAEVGNFKYSYMKKFLTMTLNFIKKGY